MKFPLLKMYNNSDNRWNETPAQGIILCKTIQDRISYKWKKKIHTDTFKQTQQNPISTYEIER